ncbi:MAG: porin [Burkholderiaceae bacterium]
MTNISTSKKALQRTLVSAALLSLVAGAAHAQSSVTLYGRVDLGYQYSDKSRRADGKDGGSVSELANGGIRPSIFGFKGSEDLGGGLKAFFNLESHFDAGTGQTTSTFFRRQANVGLSSADFGTVTLGRQYTPAVLALLATDPRAIKEQFSSLYTFALNQAGGGSNGNDLGIFAANAISYNKSFGPVNVGLLYGFGEQADTMKAGNFISAGVVYTGPITVSAYYNEIKNSATSGAAKDAKSEQYGVGVAVPFANFGLPALTAKAQYINAKQDALNDAIGAQRSDTDHFSVGVDYAWNATNVASISYYHSDNDKISKDKTEMFVLNNDFSLSKRTVIYIQTAIVDSDEGSTYFTQALLGPKGQLSPVLDKTNVIFGVGISHSF